MLGPQLAEFIESPVMILFATRDEAGRPMIGRGSGVRFDRQSGYLHFLASHCQWPKAVGEALAGRPIATTFVRAADYKAFQIKGRVLEAEPADAAGLALGQAYVAEQLAQMLALGVTRMQLSSTLSDRELVCLTIEPQAIFEQTPGPGAGRRLTPEAAA
ncbi:hypothetical protein HFO94_20945 [Rhizobium leguminosarum]|nr:hypothetical protein [Rhizobium leguminosarum]NDK51289.1 hypothetical protein [Rhizobium laguerreae]MBY5368282.1 hypothetical protein [Rhizobium leguminosarum]MBY5444087.1 hypothetical protein [Rhizobium leguminosarum]MBY5451568.1 hypothetical protein [Rhizobium leguminosarum]